MKLSNITKITMTAAIMATAVSTAHAAKGGNGQGGNGGDGGGNDTPDPDYLIAATNDYYIPGLAGLFLADGDCKAANPDLKGPGVAYLMFFPNDCTAVTSNGTALGRLAIFVEQNESGYLVGLEFRGNIGNQAYSGFADLAPADQFIPPPEDGNPDNDQGDFQINANAEFVMEACSKQKGRIVCEEAGSIFLGKLEYQFISN